MGSRENAAALSDAFISIQPQLMQLLLQRQRRQEDLARQTRGAEILSALQNRPTRQFEDEATARGILMPEERTVPQAGQLPSQKYPGIFGAEMMPGVDLGGLTPENAEPELLKAMGGATPEYGQFANRLESIREEEAVRKVMPIISDITGVDMGVLQSGGLTGLKTILPFLKMAQEGDDSDLKTVTVYNKETGDAEIMTFDPGTGQWGRTPFLAVPKGRGAAGKGPPAILVDPSTGRIDFDPAGIPTTGGGGGYGGGGGGGGTAGGLGYEGAPGTGATLGAETEKRLAAHRKAESDVTSLGQDLAAVVNLARQPVPLGKTGEIISGGASAAQQAMGLLRAVGVPLSERTFETTTGNVNRRLKSRIRTFIRRAAALTSPDRRLSNEEEKRMLDLVDSGDPTQIINGARELYRSVLEANIGEAARLGVESRFAKPPANQGGATGQWGAPQTLFEGGGEFSVRPAPFAQGPEQFLSPEAEAGAGLLALESGLPAYQGQEVSLPEGALPAPVKRGPLRLWFNPATKQFEPVPEGTSFEEEESGVGVRRVLPGGANAPQGR